MQALFDSISDAARFSDVDVQRFDSVLRLHKSSLQNPFSQKPTAGATPQQLLHFHEDRQKLLRALSDLLRMRSNDSISVDVRDCVARFTNELLIDNSFALNLLSNLEVHCFAAS